MRAARFGLAAAVLLGMTACSGAGTTTQPLFCRAITRAFDPTLALVSPAKGATGVPVTIGSVTFTASLTYDTLTLTPSDNAGVVVGGPIVASNGTDVSAIPVLRHGVTYSAVVSFTSNNGPGCVQTFPSDLGFFTAQ